MTFMPLTLHRRAEPVNAVQQLEDPTVRFATVWVESFQYVTVLRRVTRHASIAPWACTAAGDHRDEFSPGGHGTASRYGNHYRGSS